MRNLIAIAAIAAGLASTPVMAKEYSESTKDSVRRYVQLSGYSCPKVKSIQPGGIEARGAYAFVWCGPDDGTGNVYSKLRYRFIMPDSGLPFAVPEDSLW